jgi:hypothetical protein
MIRLLRSLLLLLTLVSYAAAATLVSDNFNRSDDSDLGASWSVIPGYGAEPCQIISNEVQGTTSAATCSESYTDNLPADQWASIKVVAVAGNGTPGVSVRQDNTMTEGTHYGCFANNESGGAPPGSGTVLFKIVSGSYTVIASESSSEWATNDILRLDAVGTVVDCRNGTAVASGSDSDIAGSGYAGLNSTANPLTDSIMDDFQAGNFSTAARRIIVVD